MIPKKRKKRFDPQRKKLHGIAKEFAEKVKDNPGVAAIIAVPYGTYLNLIVLLEPNIDRNSQNEVYDAYGEIFDKYEGQAMFDFNPMTCFSQATIDEMAYDDLGNIIYRKGK